MLLGISPLISPELLAILYRMGHGDEIVFADAHFPGHSTNERVIRADGLQIEDLLAHVGHRAALDLAEEAASLAGVACRAADLLDRFDPTRLPRRPWVFEPPAGSVGT